jgi:hypothetical protein
MLVHMLQLVVVLNVTCVLLALLLTSLVPHLVHSVEMVPMLYHLDKLTATLVSLVAFGLVLVLLCALIVRLVHIKIKLGVLLVWLVRMGLFKTHQAPQTAPIVPKATTLHLMGRKRAYLVLKVHSTTRRVSLLAHHVQQVLTQMH